MKKLKYKFIILLTIFIIVFGFGSWMILIHFFPELAFADYPIIPIYFYLIGLVSIFTLTKIKIDNSPKLLNTFMMIRGVKMLFAILIGVIYWLLDRAEIRSFAIMLITFYIFYLFFETYFYIQIETWNKKNKIIKKNID